MFSYGENMLRDVYESQELVLTMTLKSVFSLC